MIASWKKGSGSRQGSDKEQAGLQAQWVALGEGERNFLLFNIFLFAAKRDSHSLIEKLIEYDRWSNWGELIIQSHFSV